MQIKANSLNNQLDGQVPPEVAQTNTHQPEVTKNQNMLYSRRESFEPSDVSCNPNYGTELLHEPINNNYVTDPAYDVTSQLTSFVDNTYFTTEKNASFPITSTVLHPLTTTPPSASSGSVSDRSCEEEELIDVVNDSLGTSLGSDSLGTSLENASLGTSGSTDASCKETDISMSTQSSLSEQSPSTRSLTTSSPEHSIAVTPESAQTSKTKKRTNYSPSQVQALEKVFHENPYPDSERMEEMSRELGIAETKIKVWFQNKRARWRKRVQDDKRMMPYDHRAFPSPFMSPLSPVMSPVGSYGYLPGSPILGSPSSPSQVVPGPMMSFPRPSTSPNSPLANQKQPSPMTPPFQQRPHLPAYFYSFPYGMYPPPYFCG
ncbi:homeobox protein prophet of Pit-1-like [Pecten maximus]|uniref:homeobox protein prophet of Pit-1-like n=1 Tax=Pecten maximus TaxID=6579 RepID=UPI0014587056|nr:homeobox protein prophet of Pit-1-like [Pecten maximus]